MRGCRCFLFRPSSPVTLPPEPQANELNLEPSSTKLLFFPHSELPQDQDALTPRGSLQQSGSSAVNHDRGSVTPKLLGRPSLHYKYSCLVGREPCSLLEGAWVGNPLKERIALWPFYVRNVVYSQGTHVAWRPPAASGYHGWLRRNTRSAGRDISSLCSLSSAMGNGTIVPDRLGHRLDPNPS